MAGRRYSAEGVPLTLSRYELEPGVLTLRQRQVVGMFCAGMTGTQIAEQLGLARSTINPMLRQAARRMGARGIARSTLTRRAKATGNL